MHEKHFFFVDFTVFVYKNFQVNTTLRKIGDDFTIKDHLKQIKQRVLDLVRK